MDQLIPAISGIFLPIFLGLLSKRGNFINPAHRPLLLQFAVRVAVPFMVFDNLSSMDFRTAGQFLPMSSGLFITTGLIWLFMALFLKVFAGKAPWLQRYKAELLMMGFGGNVGYICWKLQELVLGSEGLVRGIFYTSFFWPVMMTYSFLTLFALKLHQSKKIDWKNVRYNLAPLLAMIALGFLTALTETGLPVWATGFIRSFGSMAVPVTLFCMGLSISVRASLKSALGLIPYLLIRQIIWLFSFFLLSRLPWFDNTSRGVFFINAFASLGVTIIVISEMFDLDTDFVANATTVSTVYFLLGLPFLLMLWG